MLPGWVQGQCFGVIIMRRAGSVPLPAINTDSAVPVSSHKDSAHVCQSILVVRKQGDRPRTLRALSFQEGLRGGELGLPESRVKGSLPGPDMMYRPLGAEHCCGEEVHGALLKGPTQRDKGCPLEAEGCQPSSAHCS